MIKLIASGLATKTISSWKWWIHVNPDLLPPTLLSLSKHVFAYGNS